MAELTKEDIVSIEQAKINLINGFDKPRMEDGFILAKNIYNPDGIDYKTTLIKYMRLVANAEGVDFIPNKNRRIAQGFNKEEFAEIAKRQGYDLTFEEYHALIKLQLLAFPNHPHLPKIDVDDDRFYEVDKDRTRTRTRLQEMNTIGMEEIGVASFGIPDKMSGLYIERVWSMDDTQWNDYMHWVKTNFVSI